MERHKEKGQSLTTFDFPKNTGQGYANKLSMTQATLAKYAANKNNRQYSRGIKKGFTAQYVSGVPEQTHLQGRLNVMY